MELMGIIRYLRFGAITCLAVFELAASEHHGMVRFGAIPVPGATVTATLADKKVVAITDDTGAYSFPDLADGVWKIQVEMLCFTTVTKEIGVVPNAPGAEWELKMMSMNEIKPGIQAAPPPATGTTPPATAAAPGTPAAATPGAGATATPSIVAANAPPAKPPAKGKNGKAATTAAPQGGFQKAEVNASADGAAAASSSAPGNIASADSAQSASDAFVVNGSGSNGIERRAIGNGRKGPRSLYNGGVSFQFDNAVINARQYSLTGQETPRTPYNHLQASANVGGPLWLPHVFRWTGNFFAGYQIIRNRTANNTTATMPTEDQRAGNFSKVTDKDGNPVVRDPTTGQLFPGSVIPDSQISKQAKFLMQYYPLPQFSAPGRNYNYQIPVIGRTSSDAMQVRVNKPINNKTRFQSQFAYQNTRNENNNVFSFLDTTHTSGYRASFGLNRTFTRSLFGNFGIDYSRQSVRTTPYFVAQNINASALAGITGNDQSPNDYGPPSLSFQGSGIFGLSDGNPSFNRNQTAGFSASLTYIHRPHNFTFGGDWRLIDTSQVGQQNGRGRFGFDGSTTGFDFASFLLGIPDTASLAFGNADKYLKSAMYDLYINDDWRVSPALTLNWGLRWEYGAPIIEKYGRLVNLDVAPGFVASIPVVANNPTGTLTNTQYPDSLIKPDKHAVQPRISFAWKPIFGASTVVRGAYGVYYNTSAYSAIANQMIQQSPLSKSFSVDNSAVNPLTLANGFRKAPDTVATTNAVDPNYRVGYSQNWTLSVQQNVTASMVMTGAYLGIKGTRQPQAFLPNTYPDGAVNPCTTCLPGYTYLTSNGNSTKHSGQLSVRRRFHGGLSTNFSYTFAKAIDDGTPGGQSWTTAQNWLNLAGERGLSSFDQRHLLQATFQYSSGVGVRGGALLSGWRGIIVKGWTFTSNITAGSGLPLNLSYFLPTKNTGVSGPRRPQYLGGDMYAAPEGLFLNAAAFGAPPPGQWGNAARNSITGPNQFTMTGSMARSFADNISLRIDASNVLNHPNFSSWNTTFVPRNFGGPGQFGLANPPGAMRTVQANLRWSF